MALSGVLSALRELILDEPALPESFEARVELFARSFPTLTEDEREDLAKIHPQQLRAYTGTIFAGERSVLRRRFPLTFALLESQWEQHFSEPFNRIALVKKVHSFRPWTDNKTAGLAKAFVEYLSVARSDLQEIYPHLCDVASLEFHSMMIARRKEPTLPAILSEDTISRMTVSELLSTGCAVPHNMRQEKFDFAVLSYRNAFFANDKTLPQFPEKRMVCAVGARNRFNAVRWLEVPESVYELLDECKPYQSISISELADSFLADQSNPQVEEMEQFREFLTMFLDLVRIGAVYPLNGTV